MARLPRIVLPGIPHHVTQRGNRRERVLFGRAACGVKLDLLSEAAARAREAIWDYGDTRNNPFIAVRKSLASKDGKTSPHRPPRHSASRHPAGQPARAG